MANNQQQQQLAPNVVLPNPSGVPSSVAVAGAQGAQIPAAALMAGQGGLTAQQLTALAAASGGAVIIPGIPGAMRLPLPTQSITDMMMAPGFMLPGAAATTVQHQQAAPDLSGYRDYSRFSDAASSAASKDHSFPMKLHKILSEPENAEYITWLPHGRSWRVLKPKAFEEKVIPKYFRHAKYASFMRQVNGWGYKRMTQGPDHNSYYHELFLRGMPQLCHKMRRPSKTAHAMIGTSAHPDFYSMSMYAPLPSQTLPGAAPVSNAPTDNFSGSEVSDRGIVSSSVTTYPATSSDSDRNGTDSDRNGSSGEGSGSDLGDRTSSIEDRNSGGSSDGRDETSGSDRISSYNEDISGSDPSACGSDTDRNSGSEGFDSSPTATSAKKGKKRRHPRHHLLDRADSSFLKGSGSDSSERSERSSLRDLSFLSASLLSNRQADLPSSIGVATQDVFAPQVPLMVGPGASSLGYYAAANQQGAPQQTGAHAQLAANLAAATTNQLTAPLTAANLSAVNQLSATNAAGHPLTAPLTASNLGYLSLQNQLAQSQATIAQLVAYQQRMGLPPMPAPGALMPSPGEQMTNPGDQGKQ